MAKTTNTTKKKGVKKAAKAPPAMNASASTKGPTKVTPDVKAVKNKNVASRQLSGSLYRVYILDGGRDHRKVDSWDDAQEFEAEYATIIDSWSDFPTRTKMNKFLEQATKHTEETTTPAKNNSEDDTVAVVENLTPDEKTKFNRIRTLLEEYKPHNAINVYWKTTKYSKLCCVLFCAKNEKDQDMWFIRPPFQHCVSGYHVEYPHSNIAVNEFWTNFRTAAMRDPDKGPSDAKMNIRKKDNAEFAQYIMWTTFTIPVESIPSAPKEQEFIEGVINESVGSLRQAQRTSVFMNVVKEAYSRTMYEAMMKPPMYGVNFPTYIQTARVKAIRLENLNKFVTLENSNEIKRLLFKHDLPEKKYPNDDLYNDQKESMVVKSEHNAKKSKIAVTVANNPYKKPTNTKSKHAKKISPQAVAVRTTSADPQPNQKNCSTAQQTNGTTNTETSTLQQDKNSDAASEVDAEVVMMDDTETDSESDDDN